MTDRIARRPFDFAQGGIPSAGAVRLASLAHHDPERSRGIEGRRRQIRITMAAVLVGAVVFGPGAYQWVRLSVEQRRLDRRLAALSAEHERLTHEQARLESDPAYVEGLIRSTFKLSQPGELVVPLDASSRKR